jgi:hypothetical protein
MSEQHIPKIEKADIRVPELAPGGSAIILQRHEAYQRNRGAENSGSILPEAAEVTLKNDKEFFKQLLEQESDGAETMILFVSSDTQYAGAGRRSLETAQLALDAASEVMADAGIDPASRIVNLSPAFKTNRFEPTDQDIRPIPQLREPQIFDGDPRYIEYLREKYGAADNSGGGLSIAAFTAHEADLEAAMREEYGAEGVHDIIDRTKKSVELFTKYAHWFHHHNPNKRLIIWAATHYDTISPLVKDATGTPLTEFIGVDYGGGVTIEVPPESTEATLTTRTLKTTLKLGGKAVTTTRSQQ